MAVARAHRLRRSVIGPLVEREVRYRFVLSVMVALDCDRVRPLSQQIERAPRVDAPRCDVAEVDHQVGCIVLDRCQEGRERGVLPWRSANAAITVTVPP